MWWNFLNIQQIIKDVNNNKVSHIIIFLSTSKQFKLRRHRGEFCIQIVCFLNVETKTEVWHETFWMKMNFNSHFQFNSFRNKSILCANDDISHFFFCILFYHLQAREKHKKNIKIDFKLQRLTYLNFEEIETRSLHEST